MEKIAAVVVWYNPDLKIKMNIESYISDIDKLYIIDNSEINNYHLIKEDIFNQDKICYIPQYCNLGIAKALNIACTQAIEEGFDWILTMDQDSQFHEDSFFKMKDFINKEYDEKLGIVCPVYKYKHKKLKLEFKKNIELEEVITSGNLLNLKMYTKIGKFNESFFIDLVDFEYCLRIRNEQYKIIQNSNSILLHSLGNSKNFQIFKNLEINTSNHPAIRRYYMTRNAFYFMKMYPTIKGKYLISIVLEIFKIIFFETEKIKKIKFMYYGVIDYKSEKKGKITNNF